MPKIRLQVGIRPWGEQAVRPTRIATERLKHSLSIMDRHIWQCQTDPNRDRAIETFVITRRSYEWTIVRPTRIATERLKHREAQEAAAQLPSDRPESRPSD